MDFAFYDLIGAVGVALIILTYFLLQLEKIKGESMLYSLLNAAGAGLIIFSLYFSFNLSAFLIEFFWLLISLFGIGRYFWKKKL